MNRLLAIAKNTYLQTVRQRLYAIIVLVTLAAMAMAPSLTGWTLEDDNKMLRDIGLSTLLIQGLFLACFAASSVLHTEIDDRTVLTVATKPISRHLFLLGKYLGLLGALVTAHYLAGIAFFMSMRHGVLQTSSDTSDVTVLIFGPGLMVLLLIVATALNYVLEYRFLPTLIVLSLPCFTLSMAILLLVDRDWKLQNYESTQNMENLPPEVADSQALKGIIEFRPFEGERHYAGHRGHLVRTIWQGPITEAEQAHLLDLSDSVQWKKDVNFLVQATRKQQGLEIFKAGILILAAVALLAGIALAASTRVGMLSTFLICVVVLAAGLAADQVIRPLAEDGQTWADALYRAVPNFQFFWMVDPLSENRPIPWGYVGSATVYAALYSAAVLILGMALFETREVG